MLKDRTYQDHLDEAIQGCAIASRAIRLVEAEATRRAALLRASYGDYCASISRLEALQALTDGINDKGDDQVTTVSVSSTRKERRRHEKNTASASIGPGDGGKRDGGRGGSGRSCSENDDLGDSSSNGDPGLGERAVDLEELVPSTTIDSLESLRLVLEQARRIRMTGTSVLEKSTSERGGRHASTHGVEKGGQRAKVHGRVSNGHHGTIGEIRNRNTGDERVLNAYACGQASRHGGRHVQRGKVTPTPKAVKGSQDPQETRGGASKTSVSASDPLGVLEDAALAMDLPEGLKADVALCSKLISSLGLGHRRGPRLGWEQQGNKKNRFVDGRVVGDCKGQKWALGHGTPPDEERELLFALEGLEETNCRDIDYPVEHLGVGIGSGLGKEQAGYSDGVASGAATGLLPLLPDSQYLEWFGGQDRVRNSFREGGDRQGLVG
ncbi:unnamed protein product, partial [Choristocarpus tenellus]